MVNLNGKCRAIKFLEDKIGENLGDLVSDDFLHTYTNSTVH